MFLVGSVCLFVCLSVCLSVCPSDYSQTCERILTNFFGGVGHGSRTKWYNFGGDPDHASDPESKSEIRILRIGGGLCCLSTSSFILSSICWLRVPSQRAYTYASVRLRTGAHVVSPAHYGTRVVPSVRAFQTTERPRKWSWPWQRPQVSTAAAVSSRSDNVGYRCLLMSSCQIEGYPAIDETGLTEHQ